MFNWPMNPGDSTSTPARKKRIANKDLVPMEFGRFIYVLFLLTILSALGISTSSSQSQIRCNATDDCKKSNDSGSNLTTCCGDFCQFDSLCQLNSSDTNSSSSSENSTNSSNTISNDTTQVYSGQSNTTTNLNESRLYDFCFKDSDCKFSHRICISLDCINKSPKDKIKDCKRCESIYCKDGRCYNLTSAMVPASIAPGKQQITTLQLVLLFGSMGGILVVIVIVYCVKTFTDNRRRQYLLKYGVWENPPNKDGKDKPDEKGDIKSEAKRQQRKLEVPTITVETETDSSSKKKKNKENSKDEITDTEGLEEYGKAVGETDNLKHKVICTDQPARIEGDPISPHKTENQVKLNANHSTNATKKPYSGKTKIGETIESPKNIRMPTAWDKDDEKTPLTQSPKPKRFVNVKKNKDSSPSKIIANGTPEKSPRFTKQNKNSPPVQLCEPENFSDFGM